MDVISDNDKSLNDALLVHFTGKRVGTFRDASDLLPVVARAADADAERNSPSSLSDTQIWSPQYQTYVPIIQIASSFDTA